MILDSGGPGSREEFEACYGSQDSLGLFIRGLVGLDRDVEKFRTWRKPTLQNRKPTYYNLLVKVAKSGQSWRFPVRSTVSDRSRLMLLFTTF